MASFKPGHENLGHTPERLTIVDSASSWPTDTGQEVGTGARRFTKEEYERAVSPPVRERNPLSHR